jgi:uroporphyrinogen decarboxylase
MTGKERFFEALAFRETDRPPHYESMFELEYEAFGLRFPDRKLWNGVGANEKDRMIGQCMEIYQRIVERFEWDALMVYWPWGDPDGIIAAKQTFGDSIAIGGVVGGALWAIDTISDWDEFSINLVEDMESIHKQAQQMLDAGVELVGKLVDAGADYIFLPHDVAFNGGPFVSPITFREIVTPYLAKLVKSVKDAGVPAIFHSDGMLMPILDQILECEPDCLHSIDPMAGMDIAEVKRLTYPKMAIMGNVQCNYLQDGPDELIRQSARYCLENAAPGGGYIFSSSNTIFEGLPLRNYEVMIDEMRAYASGKWRVRS